jgi:hypothetical protein
MADALTELLAQSPGKVAGHRVTEDLSNVAG